MHLNRRVFVMHCYSLCEQQICTGLCIRAVSQTPVLFAQVSDRPGESFSQRTRRAASLRDRECTLKDLFDGKAKKPFSSRLGSLF